MIKNYNWKAFSVAMAVIGLMYLAAYLYAGIYTWWAVPIALVYAFGAGLAWQKGGAK